MFEIFTGNSAGCLKLLQFDRRTREVTEVKQSFHHRKPIISLSTWKYGMSHIGLLSGDTIGRVMFWIISDVFTNENWEPIHTIRIHQSGVNAISQVVLKENILSFVTGGDDQSLCITQFVMDSCYKVRK